MGDRAYESLGGKTPLQSAHTPNLDKLAGLGANGVFHATRLGYALPSENAHFAMFGFKEDEFPGRGPLEALGAGLELAGTEIALLAHFVSAREDEGVLVLHKDRPAVSMEEAAELSAAISTFTYDDIEVRYHQTKGLDGIITVSGALSPEVTDSDPLTEGSPLIAVEPHRQAKERSSACRSAQVLSAYLKWCYETLATHPINSARAKQGLAPVNMVVSQRAGRLREVEPFARRWGLKGLSISSGIVYWGLSRFLGFELHKVKDSKEPGQDLAQRLEYALAQRDAFDFIHVHTKVPDAAAHSKKPQNKVAAIEQLDQGLSGLVQHLDEETLFIITADHSTPSGGPQVHSGEPVPFLMLGPGMRCDLVQGFDEVQCGQGCLGSVRGRDLMPLVLNGLDLAKLQGLMDTPDDQPFWPGARTPFRVK